MSLLYATESFTDREEWTDLIYMYLKRPERTSAAVVVVIVSIIIVHYDTSKRKMHTQTDIN